VLAELCCLTVTLAAAAAALALDPWPLADGCGVEGVKPKASHV